jgi:hypothetical protein
VVSNSVRFLSSCAVFRFFYFGAKMERKSRQLEDPPDVGGSV